MHHPRPIRLALGLSLTLAACGDAAGHDVDTAPETDTIDDTTADADGVDDAAPASDTADVADDDGAADVEVADTAPEPSPYATWEPDPSLVIGRHEVLFVGNSYTYVNDVPGRYRGLLASADATVRAEVVAPGGYRLVQHSADALGDGTALAGWLRTRPAAEAAFDAVVLQEQSQIGGFPTGNADRAASVAAARQLADLATARGAAVVLYQTWGREHGDAANAGIGYGTFASMEDRLEDGYRDLATVLAEAGAEVRVAPVGGAFRTVYDDVAGAGADPALEGSDFDLLYESDGSHPSVRGAYLAACVIAGTITAADPTGFDDEPSLGAEVSARLRDACARTLADPRWHVAAVGRPATVLTGTPSAGVRFGEAVALDDAGATALVGAPGYGGGPAVTRVFSVADGWTETDAWEDASGVGAAIAFAGDGRTALLGVPWRVYRHDADGWTADDAGDADPAGFSSLSASRDGSTVLIDGWGDTPGAVARVLSHGPEGWTVTPLGDPSAVSGAPNVPAFQAPGVTVSLAADGRRALVCTSGDAVARVFVRDDAGWREEGVLTTDLAGSLAPLGRTRCALSASGRRALVGLPDRDHVVTFVREGGAWTAQATARGPWSSGFGSAVALTADGRYALVGAPRDTPEATGATTGSLRLFAVGAAGFREEALLVPALPLPAVADGRLGEAAALSADGARILGGAPEAVDAAGHADAGAVYVFEPPLAP